MNSFGYKIVEKEAHAIEPVVEAALDEQRPLEVGLYFGDPTAWEFLQARLAKGSIPVNTHLDHKRLSLFDLAEREAELHQQMALAQRLGSAYSVTHLHYAATTQRVDHRDRLGQHLAQQLQVLERVCAEYDHPVHIENTFHNLEQYRWFFDLVQRLDLKYVHHCFDLGHAKVWSQESLPQWILWLRELRAKGLRLHFHLHANNGLADQHLSFVEAEEQGLNTADSYTLKWDYFAAMAQLQQHFPECRKVFEVKPHYALANMTLVQSRLGAIT